VKSRYKYPDTYIVWNSMRMRCLNPHSQHYKNYGGRGIKVCERWNEFMNFLSDMGCAPEDLTLERIDNNGNYCKENCRWATRKEQALNRRCGTIVVEIDSRRDSVRGWIKILGVPPAAIIRAVRKNGTTHEQEIRKYLNGIPHEPG